MYVILIALIKMSVLSMYRRIFPTPFVTYGSYVLAVVVLLWWLAVTLLTFLQCIPLESLWNTAITGVCVDRMVIFMVNAIPNITTDVLILMLPLYEVIRLQMGLPKKIGVSAIFILAGL
jgi:hypothetical protein